MNVSWPLGPLVIVSCRNGRATSANADSVRSRPTHSSPSCLATGSVMIAARACEAKKRRKFVSGAATMRQIAKRAHVGLGTLFNYAQDKRDLVAYLTAVGDGVQPYERDGAGATLKEINDFNMVLATAVPSGDKAIVALAVDTIGQELRELTERYPDRKNTSVSGGEQQRVLARNSLKELVLFPFDEMHRYLEAAIWSFLAKEAQL